MGTGSFETADPFLGSQETQGKQNRETHETILLGNFTINNPDPTGLMSWWKWLACHWWGVLSVVINVVLVIIFFVQPVKKCESCPAAPPRIMAACPDGWVRHQGKCYYFSEDEANWTSSQSNCSAYGTSLAGIDTPQEMDFMKRYKGPSHYWIGLQRDLGQPWKWTNSTEFNHWFKIEGEEQCAFMSLKISSSSCSGDERWICSKPAKKTEDKAKGL